jgi:hypothetical protein
MFVYSQMSVFELGRQCDVIGPWNTGRIRPRVAGFSYGTLESRAIS